MEEVEEEKEIINSTHIQLLKSLFAEYIQLLKSFSAEATHSAAQDK
jgi:hypothetical protein